MGLKIEQEKVAEFVEKNDLESPPEFRLLDALSELGEVAKDVNESTEYGKTSQDVEVNQDEIGDVLFSVLAFADSVGIDSEEALQTALDKYRERFETKGDPSSR
jgi:NTP pyrophosphatase (non-canonical NTP hydrolase)